MTFWIQHGFGKADKITNVANTGQLTGIVLSPADERREALELTVQTARGQGIALLLDPQLYIHTIAGAVARHHEQHGLDFGTVPWFVSPDEIAAHVAAIVSINQRLGIESIVAPTPHLSSFGDEWSSVSLQYAHATINSTDRPVYISLVVEASAFTNWEATQRYLAALTTLDAAGIYLIIGTSGYYPLLWNSKHLANILRVVYILTEYNRYETIWGYSDLAGVLGLVCGATGAATGWYHSLRMWTIGKWIPRDGGRQANPRMFAEPVLSAIEQDESVNIAGTSHGSRAFRDLEDRRRLVAEDSWGLVESQNQHLAAIARLHQEVDQNLDISDRIERFQNRLEEAMQLLTTVTEEGAAVNRAHLTRLTALTRALEIFVAAENL